ncbi:hypothetical protein Pan181_14210 [Aeoliella mucimassa]|uniref:Uncharacterized protein n=1 Tax=Aeoliella mucimassa TaxID=2527972 RepID=A0A518AKI0_9BACT|nr:hypothetical protein Pan181_14210 [Aeoliella mucimassa]
MVANSQRKVERIKTPNSPPACPIPGRRVGLSEPGRWEVENSHYFFNSGTQKPHERGFLAVAHINKQTIEDTHSLTAHRAGKRFKSPRRGYHMPAHRIAPGSGTDAGPSPTTSSRRRVTEVYRRRGYLLLSLQAAWSSSQACRNSVGSFPLHSLSPPASRLLFGELICYRGF